MLVPFPGLVFSQNFSFWKPCYQIWINVKFKLSLINILNESIFFPNHKEVLNSGLFDEFSARISPSLMSYSISNCWNEEMDRKAEFSNAFQWQKELTLEINLNILTCLLNSASANCLPSSSWTSKVLFAACLTMSAAACLVLSHCRLTSMVTSLVSWLNLSLIWPITWYRDANGKLKR